MPSPRGPHERGPPRHASPGVAARCRGGLDAASGTSKRGRARPVPQARPIEPDAVGVPPLLAIVRPKQTDHEFAATPDVWHSQVPRYPTTVSYRSIDAFTRMGLDRLLRTITAPCTPLPDADLTPHACALMPAQGSTVWPQNHVLELEVMGLVLP